MSLKQLEPVVERKKDTRPGVDVNCEVSREEVIEGSRVEDEVDGKVSVEGCDQTEGRDQEGLDAEDGGDLVES